MNSFGVIKYEPVVIIITIYVDKCYRISKTGLALITGLVIR
jgi:hypothetical protein